jgi:hypothetical protein
MSTCASSWFGAASNAAFGSTALLGATVKCAVMLSHCAAQLHHKNSKMPRSEVGLRVPSF